MAAFSASPAVELMMDGGSTRATFALLSCAMCVMVALTAEERLKVAARFAGSMREVGTLLIAFAPLDYTMQEAADPWTLAGFLVAGGALLTVSIFWEVIEGL